MKSAVTILIAMTLGFVGGRAFHATPEKPPAAGTRITVSMSQEDAPAGAETAKPRLNPKDLALRLYDAWDERQAEEWLGSLTVEELREVVQIAGKWSDEPSRFLVQLFALDAWSKIDLPQALAEAKKLPRLSLPARIAITPYSVWAVPWQAGSRLWHCQF